MSPLEYFLYYKLHFSPYEISEWELEYERDTSNYHIIDNEEADYGIIKYFHNGVHICDYYNHGGDSYDYNYTPEGIEHFKEIAKEIFQKSLNEIKL